MNDIGGLKVQFIEIRRIGFFFYEIYEIDKTKYNKPYIIYNNPSIGKCLIEVNDHRIILVPLHTPEPSSYELYKLGYQDCTIVLTKHESTGVNYLMTKIDPKNSISDIERLGAYDSYHAYKNIKYVEVRKDSKTKYIFHIGKIDAHIHVSYVMPCKGNYIFYEGGSNTGGCIITSSYEIPMLKNVYIHIYVSSVEDKYFKKNHKLQYIISMSKPKNTKYTVVYDTVIYGHITYTYFLSLCDIISLLSKHKDNRRWSGFEDIKFIL